MCKCVYVYVCVCVIYEKSVEYLSIVDDKSDDEKHEHKDKHATHTHKQEHDDDDDDDIQTHLRWRSLTDMNTVRNAPSACVLGKHGTAQHERIAVMGGYDDKFKTLKSCEIWKCGDDTGDTWTEMRAMNVERWAPGCMSESDGSKMVVAGGWNSKAQMSMEEYDTHKNTWVAMPDMAHAHRGYPLVYTHPLFAPVIVVCGDDLHSTSRYSDNGVIEMYDRRSWGRGWMTIGKVDELLHIDSEYKAKTNGCVFAWH